MNNLDSICNLKAPLSCNVTYSEDKDVDIFKAPRFCLPQPLTGMVKISR